jgi:uncharacterized protein (DUF1778 family)
MSKDAVLSARIPSLLKEVLERAALKEDRSFSNYVTRALTDHAVAKGLLPQQELARPGSPLKRSKKPSRRA